MDEKIITLNKQVLYFSKRGYFFTTLKTKASERYIVIDDFLVGELRRWKNHQSENENSAGNSYVYVYCNTENKMIQQSKSLAIEYNRAEMVCTRADGHAFFKTCFQKF